MDSRRDGRSDGAIGLIETEQAAVAAALAGAEGLLLYANVLADEPGQAYLALLRALADERPAAEVRTRAAALFRALAAAEATGDSQDAWQAHLARRLRLDDNPFSRAAQRQDLAEIPAGLQRAARQDLRALGQVFHLAGARLAGLVAAAAGGAVWPDLADLTPPGPPEPLVAALRTTAPSAWADRLADLAAHYRRAGVGRFAEHRAFRWARTAAGGHLAPIRHPDPISFDDLIGYAEQRQVVRRNTEHFLRGWPANNLLLYGERGTGKSSTVKALLPAYADQGLRLIEVPKSALGDFPAIVAEVAEQPERFILFIDDLSFDENETGYTELKAILEGGVEARPANVLLYATSNRRHLVLERFGDRAAPSDEVHVQDTLQEKLSLADRFGVTVIFLAPDQEQYLAIVRGLAQRRGLAVDDARLRREALQWATWNNGRSGRSARQFIDDLTAELSRRSG